MVKIKLHIALFNLYASFLRLPMRQQIVNVG